MKQFKGILYAIIVLLLAAFSSCSKDGSSIFPVLDIDPNNFAVTEVIGSEGGIAVVGDQNPVSAKTFVRIPAGALSESTEISMKGVNPVTKGISFQGKTDGIFLEFGPHGTVFDKPVQIGIPYLDDDPGNKKIYYLNEEKNRWEPIPVLAIDEENKIIIAETNHFSTYTVQGSNLILDANLYKDGGSLYGAVKLLTPMDEVSLEGGTLNELMIQQPQNVRAAFRISLKKQLFALPDPLGEWFDQFVAPTEVVTHYYRVDQVLGPLYIVEAEDESGTVLLNSLTRGDNLDFAGMERYYSGEPLLFNFAMPANTNKKYYLTVDLYYLKGDVSIDDATPADIWGGQGNRIIAYSSAEPISAMDPVSDVDQNGDGIVDTSSDGTSFDHAPNVSISAPATDITATEGDTVTFSGSAIDLEDGPVTGGSLIWTSDIDGQIGTGDSLDISTLSVNTHTITLSVTDSVGNSGTASVMVNVEPEPPVITARSPEPDAVGVLVGSSIYVTFSKDMDAGTINSSTFIVKDSEDTIISGVYDYDSRVASFTPADPWEYGETYTVTMTAGILDTFACPLASEANWNFLAESVKVELEDVTFPANGTGYFGGTLNRMAKDDGNPLLDTIDFSYGFDLLSIYDTGNGGAFENGKYMRVVENGLNAASSSGLNLTPVAIDINVNDAKRWTSPPPDSFYIDPEQSRLIMPRPIYWSTMGSDDDITNPAIVCETPVVYGSGNQTASTSGKFGSAIYKQDFMHHGNQGYSFQNSEKYIRYRGQTDVENNKGTLSCWVRIYGHAYSEGWFSAGTANSSVIITFANDYRLELKRNSYSYGGALGIARSDTSSFIAELHTIDSASSVPVSYHDEWMHVYIVWDKQGNLSDGRTVRVWINGIPGPYLESYRNGSLAVFASPSIVMKGGVIIDCAAFAAPASVETKQYIDNLKVWDHAVSEDPSWEYNSGSGREDALHAIYGADSGYRPVLTGTNSGVGYYYVPEEPGTSAAPSIPANFHEEYTASSTARLVWNSSVDSDGTVIGYNIYRSTTSGSGFEKVGTAGITEYTDDSLSPFTQYYYIVRAVDDTGVESADSAEVNVSIEPEIAVREGDVEVANSGMSPVSNVPVRATRNRVFNIENRGDIDLDLTGTPLADITGTDASLFTVVEAPDAVVPAGGSTSFTIAFKAEDAGSKSADVAISNSDADESAFIFTIRGMGTYGKTDVGLYNSSNWGIVPGGEIRKFESVGDGSFKKESISQLGISDTTQIVSGDFNGDGYFDIALYDSDSDEIVIWKGGADGNYHDSFTLTFLAGGKIFTGDFDRDGFWDIGLYNAGGDGNIRIRYSDGSYGLSGETVYNWGAYAGAQAFAGDFNGDGYFDIGLYNIESDGRFHIRVNDGSSNFSEWLIEDKWILFGDQYSEKVNYSIGEYDFEYGKYQDYSKVVAGDFNGDGYWDLGIYYCNYINRCVTYTYVETKCSKSIDGMHSGLFITRFNNGSSFGELQSHSISSVDKNHNLIFGYIENEIWGFICAFLTGHAYHITEFGQFFTSNFDTN